MNPLQFVKSKLSFFIVLMMGLGLAYGSLFSAAPLKSWVTPVLIFMIYPMMINLKASDLFKAFSNPKPLAFSILLNFLISPALAFVLSRLFFPGQPELVLGLVLISLLPTSGMTPSWTGLAKGNVSLSLILISVNMLLSIVFIPLYMNLFLGEIVSISTASILSSLTKVIVIPLVLGNLTRILILWLKGESTYTRLKPRFGEMSSLGVLLIVFIAMALKSHTILGDLSLVASSLVPLALYYGSLLVISHGLGKSSLPYEDHVALTYGSTMRNLTLALGLSLSAFGDSLAVFLIAISYMIQAPLGAIYQQFLTWQSHACDCPDCC
jgi:ACR3 family arsenite efflux pump ArsB